MQQRQVMKMTLRKVFGVLTILCLLTLTGAAIPASAAQETSQPAPEIEMADPTAVRLAIGDRLEYELPMDTMEIIGRYNVTIDPTENFTVEPLNLDSPLEVKRNTPIGALDAVARSGKLNYTTYYYTASDQLIIDSINEYVYQDDQLWFALYDLNKTFYETNGDTKEHNLSDGETLWFIYCDLSDYDPRYESLIDRAVAGLSITVTYGKETPPGYPTPVGGTESVTEAPVSPTPVSPTPVSPTPVSPTPVSPTPVSPTPVSPTPVSPTPVSPTPVPPAPPADGLTITADDIANLQWQDDPLMPGWLTAKDPARGLTFYKDPGTPDLILIMTANGEWYGYSVSTGMLIQVM
jgi:hypothetical protein